MSVSGKVCVLSPCVFCHFCVSRYLPYHLSLKFMSLCVLIYYPFSYYPFFALKKGLDQITLKEQMLAFLPLALTEIIYALATGILLLNPQ